MKKVFTASSIAVLAAATGSLGYVAPAVAQSSADAINSEQARELSSRLGHDSLEDAQAAGHIAAVDGGYALTPAGLEAARAAGLLVSPALIPVAVGTAVAIVGLGSSR